jgi:hypothetical protein
VNAVKRGFFAGAIGAGFILAASCSTSSSDQNNTTPPVFVDAGSDAAPDTTTPPVLCNLAAPSCSSSAAPKCTVLDTPAGYIAGCVPETGTRAIGERCQRRELGYDDCSIGALCSTVAVAGDGELVCRKLCITPAECQAPERCYRFSLGQPEIYGMCVPACQPLDSDCGTGRQCIFVLDAARDVFGMCDTHGALPEGEACGKAQDCDRGMACVTDRGCRQYCDAAHPCTAPDRACTNLNFVAFPGLGVCLPT